MATTSQPTHQWWHWPGQATTTPSTGESEKHKTKITSITGPTTLLINSEGTWTANVSTDATSTLHYSVKWGDEGTAQPLLRAALTNIQTSATFTHEYATAGTYHPEFTVTDTNGRTSTKSTTVIVTDTVQLHLDSITPTSGAASTTATLTGTGFNASSTVWVGGVAASNVSLSATGMLSFTIPSSLKAGTYNVKVKDGDRTSNALSFKVTAARPALSISGIDAPVMLSAGEEGVWTVHASTASSNLHYSVVWGDEEASPLMRAASMNVDTSSTFTHSYDTAGTYSPKFTVSDGDGHSATVSATVVVK